MSAAKHTSEEWTVLDLRGVYVIAGAGLTVADVVHQSRLGEQIANARLIAAAPELLEALQAIFAAMHPDIPGAPGSAIEKARAAIAKATGAAQ